MKQTLTIPLLNGETWSVEAEIMGDLALHRARKDPKNWSVTHVPTLLTFVGAMSAKVQELSKPKLLRWMKLVQAEPTLSKDWKAMRTFSRENILTDPEHTKGVRGRIRDYCLTVTEIK